MRSGQARGRVGGGDGRCCEIKRRVARVHLSLRVLDGRRGGDAARRSSEVGLQCVGV